MVLLSVSDRNLRFRTHYRCPLGTNIRQVPLTVQEQMLEQMQVFNVGEDCPVFSHMFQFCQVSELVQSDLQMQSLEANAILQVIAISCQNLLVCLSLCLKDGCVLQSYSGGSIGGAVKLNHGQAHVVINWSGGLHHAKKAEVMGQLPRTVQLSKECSPFCQHLPYCH